MGTFIKLTEQPHLHTVWQEPPTRDGIKSFWGPTGTASGPPNAGAQQGPTKCLLNVWHLLMLWFWKATKHTSKTCSSKPEWLESSRGWRCQAHPPCRSRWGSSNVQLSPALLFSPRPLHDPLGKYGKAWRMTAKLSTILLPLCHAASPTLQALNPGI